MQEFNFAGRTVVVSSGTDETGQAVCAAFAAQGARIAVCGSDLAAAQREAARLRAAGADAEGFAADPGRRQDLAMACAAIIGRFGCIDILINNSNAELAADERVPLHEMDMDLYDAIVDAGIKSFFTLSQLCMQDMARHHGGSVVNITSVRGLVPVAGQTPIVAVAAAVIGLTRMWSVELKEKQIRVNAVAAGITSCADPQSLSHLAIQRPADPKEIAAAALFLASDAASYITGAVLPVDGGLNAGYVRSF